MAYAEVQAIYIRKLKPQKKKSSLIIDGTWTNVDIQTWLEHLPLEPSLLVHGHNVFVNLNSDQWLHTTHSNII